MPYIIAVDFDGTLFEDEFPYVGNAIIGVVEKVKEFQMHGASVILWTCREFDRLADAIVISKMNGIQFDAINENSPVFLKYAKLKGFSGAHRKIYADIYVDDRANGSIQYFLGLDAKKICEKHKDKMIFTDKRKACLK